VIERLRTKDQLKDMARCYNSLSKDQLILKTTELRRTQRELDDRLKWIEIGMRGDGEEIFAILCANLNNEDHLTIAGLLLTRKK
jgi:hypothetical protein